MKRLAGTPQAVAHLEAALGELDWFSFVCATCAEETFVGREPHQSVEDFALMLDWLYGSPPVCSECCGRGRQE